MFCTGQSFKFKCPEKVKAQVMELANDAQYKEKVLFLSPCSLLLSSPISLTRASHERSRSQFVALLLAFLLWVHQYLTNFLMN